MVSRKRRVLIVDDVADQRDIHATYLRFHGYETLEASSGEEALRVTLQQRPDLVIMDVKLPRMDGWRATERLKSDPVTREIPILILTARVLTKDRARSVAAGADAYLPKPCELDQVLEQVERLIRSAATSATPLQQVRRSIKVRREDGGQQPQES